MANGTEHCFVCLFAICLSSSVKCLFMSFVHFLDVYFCFFFKPSFKCSLCILDTSPSSPLSNMWFADIFFQLIAYLFLLFIGYFTEVFFSFAFDEVFFFPFLNQFFLLWICFDITLYFYPCLFS